MLIIIFTSIFIYLSILNFYCNIIKWLYFSLFYYFYYFHYLLTIIFFSLFFFLSFSPYLDILWEFSYARYSQSECIYFIQFANTDTRYIAETTWKIACVLEFPREYAPSRNMIAGYLFLSTTMNEFFFIIYIDIQPHRDFSL